MKKLFLLCLTLASFVAKAQICESGGSAYAHWPGIVGSGFTSGYQITNVSNEPITVTVQLRDPNGVVPNISADQFSHNFSSTNTPLSVNGAILQPGQQGDFYFLNSRNLGVAKISWKASSSGCINSAVVASTLSYYSVSGRYGYTINPINSSQPF